MSTRMKSILSNPFSMVTNQPKIPDGRAPYSMGAKRNMITTVNFDTTSTMDIIISPRFDSPIYYASKERSTSNTTLPAISGGPGFLDNHPFARAWVSAGLATGIKADTASEVSKIRLVSQGTKITLTNSTDDNDGFFEAFRFCPAKDLRTYVADAALPAPGAYVAQATVAADMFGNRDAASTAPFEMNLASKGNYTTGKLRNLHRYTWVNKPNSKEIHFKDLPSGLYVGATAATQLDPTQAHASVAFQDWDYDVIWIRVHGRGIATAQQGGCCLPTKLMVHVVQNVECIFGEQNLLHSFMTKGLSAGMTRSRVTRKYAPKKRTYKKKKTKKSRS